MPLTNRFGLLTASESTRTKVTEDAGSSSAFLLTKTRPVAVAAHSVEESLAVRRRSATPLPPAGSGPKPLPINCPAALGSPSGAQSPQGTLKAGEFVAIRAEGADALGTHALRLRPPYVSSARIHGGTDRWIGNDGEIELGRLGIDEKAVSNPVPVGHIAAAEVHINLGAGISVEAEVRVRDGKSGQAAVAKDGLRPLLRVSSRFPRAVVLRSSLNIVDVERIHREPLELQSPKSLVHAD